MEEPTDPNSATLGSRRIWIQQGGNWWYVCACASPPPSCVYLLGEIDSQTRALAAFWASSGSISLYARRSFHSGFINTHERQRDKNEDKTRHFLLKTSRLQRFWSRARLFVICLRVAHQGALLLTACPISARNPKPSRPQDCSWKRAKSATTSFIQRLGDLLCNKI